MVTVVLFTYTLYNQKIHLALQDGLGKGPQQKEGKGKGEKGERERETSAFATANQTFLPQANVVRKSIFERKITGKRWIDERIK